MHAPTYEQQGSGTFEVNIFRISRFGSKSHKRVLLNPAASNVNCQ